MLSVESYFGTKGLQYFNGFILPLTAAHSMSLKCQMCTKRQTSKFKTSNSLCASHLIKLVLYNLYTRNQGTLKSRR